jgi:hypothetical protein
MIKSSFHILAQNCQEMSKKLTNNFDDFLGFVHCMAKKSAKKCLNLQMRTKIDYRRISNNEF